MMRIWMLRNLGIGIGSFPFVIEPLNFLFPTLVSLCHRRFHPLQ